ncbi:acyltransferase family protein [Parafilimonas sp.]|uniref:acyltransferase family protein n=1 Tax=Parafilimonas sp. TaxID=1969739 RepID=UPI0039E377F1
MAENRTQRFVTLDVFRGITVCLMIIVNTQGGGATPFAQMMHAGWNGCTLTDLVFPSFLFAVGNAMVFAGRKFETMPSKAVWHTIIKRTLLIFIIGYLLAWYPFIGWNGAGKIWCKPLAETRIMAVLQRIALCYFIAAVVVKYASQRKVVVLSAALLFLYWALLFLFGDKGAQLTIEGNAVRKLDLLLIGEQHIYKEQGIAFDPEGLLSTIPAVVNVLTGYLTSAFIVRKGATYECIAKLLMAGLVLIFTGLCWNTVFPFNKKLWTSSYVCYTSGIDIIVMGLLFYLIECKQWKAGVYFFTVFGKNPLFIYVLSNLLGAFFMLYVSKDVVLADWLSENIFQIIAPGPFGCLLFAVSFTFICWLAGLWMDKKKIYIRL